jgi:AP endonuclease-1
MLTSFGIKRVTSNPLFHLHLKKLSMPPKSSKTKRKDVENESPANAAPEAKKAKVNTEQETEATVDGPNNTTMPTDLSYPKLKPGEFKIAQWNVASLPASLKKGFMTYAEAEDADVLCICETKLPGGPKTPLLDEMYPYQ